MGAFIKTVDGSEIQVEESLEEIERFIIGFEWIKVAEQLGSKQDGFMGTRTTIINVGNIIKIY